ncbi:MAG: adenosine kinase, partial [Candidatus Pacebacteria bacterium]|nr:adenosine kinase [Candidatus Paceibacterota bacterium]
GRLPEIPYRVPGGSAANTVTGIAKLGLKAGLLTKVGDDESGTYYREALAAAGVDEHAFKLSADIATGACVALVTPDSERTMRTFLGASATMTPEDVSPEDFEPYAYAHIEGYLLFNVALIQKVLVSATAAGCQVVLDLAAPEVVKANLEVLPSLLDEYVDVVLANEDEAAAFSDTRDERAALDALGSHCGVAVVKLGARGALIKRGGEDVVTVPAYTVKAVDTTGAGDLWAAGFLYGLLDGLELKKAGDIGARIAAEVIKETGAVLPEEVWVRLRDDLQATA